MRKLIVFVTLFIFLLIILGIGFLFSEDRSLVLWSRAIISEAGSNSFSVVTPSCATADGEQITRLYVYCLNQRGLGVGGLVVRIVPKAGVQDLQVSAVQATTDDLGKAIFDSRSRQPGMYDMVVSCGGYTLPQTQKLCFKPQ